MPNRSNITSPINIHGLGRSGTTVLQNLLGQAGFIQICNETAALVFNCYRGGELLLPSHDKEVIGLPGDGSAAVTAVHAALCGTAGSSKTTWCQKLGGIPNSVVWESLITEDDLAFASTPYPFPYRWYWRVLRKSFPHSRDVLILRDWKDIVVSRVAYSGYRAEDVARDLAVYWNAMAHPDARPDLVVHLSELIASPESVGLKIFSALGLEFKDDYVRALDWYATGRQSDLAASQKRKFGREADFAALDQSQANTLTNIMTPALERLLARHPSAKLPNA